MSETYIFAAEDIPAGARVIVADGFVKQLVAINRHEIHKLRDECKRLELEMALVRKRYERERAPPCPTCNCG